MCGLVGVIHKSNYGMFKKHTEIFTEMLYCDAVRGWDSTGAFSVNKYGNVEHIKSKGTPIQLIGTKTYIDVMERASKNGKFLIGHNRKATTGVINDQNAHPFVENNIILVHNGVIYNHKKHANTEVDSHAIVHMINNMGAKEALPEIDGAYALIWYNANTKQLHFARNEKRPLYITELGQFYLLSSEAGLAKWMVSRLDAHDVKQAKEPVLIPTHTIHTIGAEQDIFTTEKVEEKKTGGYPIPFVRKPTAGTASSKQVPVLLASKGSSKSTEYPKGGVVVFNFDKWTHRAANNEWVLHGTDSSNIHAHISCLLTPKQKALIETMLPAQLFAKVMSCVETSGVHAVVIDFKSILPSWELKSLNKAELNPSIWAKIEHKCWKCKSNVDFFEIEDSIVSLKKNNKAKIICPHCIATDRKYKHYAKRPAAQVSYSPTLH